MGHGAMPVEVVAAYGENRTSRNQTQTEFHCIACGGSVEGKTWPRMAVLGAGAVGCYFGGMLARAGAPVTLIGRPHHMEAIARDGLWLESLHFQERVPVAASVAVEAVSAADVVLFCVKTLDTEEAARSLARHLS